jgi:hypothetical protein
MGQPAQAVRKSRPTHRIAIAGVIAGDLVFVTALHQRRYTMNPTFFDSLSRRFATRRMSRRTALATGVGLVTTGLLSTSRASAQDATPSASPAPFPADPHPSADSAKTHVEYLFVQPFDGGTWTPKPGADGVFMLTLSGAAAETTYFSDRPERDAGLAPTQKFLDGIGFLPENPPNAAIVARSDSGEEDVLVVELLTPVYDADAATLTYEAKVLRDYGGRGLSDLAQQQTDYDLATTFGEGSLFIDDCPNSLLDHCWYPAANGDWDDVGLIQSGNCWNSKTWLCAPCGSYSGLCNQTYPACENKCADDIAICGLPDCYGDGLAG